MSKCKWSIKSGVTDKAKSLSKEIGLSSVATQVLINRGLDTADGIDLYFNPSI